MKKEDQKNTKKQNHALTKGSAFLPLTLGRKGAAAATHPERRET